MQMRTGGFWGELGWVLTVVSGILRSVVMSCSSLKFIQAKVYIVHVSSTRVHYDDKTETIEQSLSNPHQFGQTQG